MNASTLNPPPPAPDVRHLPAAFELDVRVYYEDTDAGGVVFYANYLKFFERARSEWLRTLGFNQSDLARRLNRIFVVHSLDMRYVRPARLDDTLTIRSIITRVGRASVHFAQSAVRDGEMLAEGNIHDNNGAATNVIANAARLVADASITTSCDAWMAAPAATVMPLLACDWIAERLGS